jgi:hypothetical protein
LASNNKLTIDTSGNVGIGTTNPNQKLEVAGNVFAIGNIYAYGDANNSSTLAASGYLQLRNSGNTNVNIRSNGISYFNGGNVGIGTTSPQTKLQVVYTDTHTSGDLSLSNSAFDIYNDSTTDVAGKGSTLTFSDNYSGTNKTTRAAIKGGTEDAGNTANGFLAFYTDSGGANSMQERIYINEVGAIKFNNYDSTNRTGTPTYLLGTDASGNVVKTLSTPSPITSQAASLYDLIPNGAFTTTYAFTSTAGTYAEVMSGDDVITAAGTYSVQMYVNDYAVGGTQYREYYSGVMSWNAPDSTNDTGIGAVSEIVLHRAGHAANAGITYLRTRETGSAGGNELRLEIMCNKTYTGASNVVFKFVRLI